MEFSLYKVTRAALLGTTALVAAGQSSSVRADVTIAANTTNTVSPLVAGDNVTITNTGSVTGTNVGIQVNSPISAGIVQNSGAVTVSMTGILFNGAGSATSIGNTGLIDGGGIGININSGSTISGGITNGTTLGAGTIIGSSTGILVRTSDVNGGITNQGSITGGVQGLVVDNAAINNGINNSGTLQGTGATGIGVAIGNTSSVTGGLTNSGLIQGNGSGNGINISGSTLTGGIANQTGGQVIAQSNAAIVIAASNVTGGVSNQGSITGSVALAVSGSASLDTVDNGGLMSGTVNGIVIIGTVSGGIDNSGTISATGSESILVQLGASVGGIRNNGTVSGGTNGITVTDGAQISNGIDNRGRIEGASIGINVSNTSTVSGGIANSGEILTSFDSVIRVSGSQVNGSIYNQGGEIRGPGVGIFILNSTVTGGIFNEGNIVGVTGIRINTTSNVTGGITNRGTITGFGGTSIQLSPADNILTLGTGSNLNGAVQAGLDDGDVLNLIETGSEDDMLVGFERLNMNGEEWTLTSDLTLVEGPSLFGDANINSGILYMNGTLTAPAGVSAIGGKLAGSGNIVANVTVGSGGAIAPGNSIGVLNITGDVALGPGSFFDVEVEGSTADLLNVTGNVTIDPSSTVNVIPLGAGIDVVDQVIIDAGGTINANFQNIEPGGLIATTELRGTSQIILNVVTPAAADIGNQAGVEDGFAFQEAMAAPGLGTFFVGPERRFWAKGIHEFNERDNSANFAGFDQEIWGTVIGMDGEVNDTLRLGGALGYTESDVDINLRTGDVDIQGLYAGVYGHYDKNAFHLTFGAQVGTQDKDLNRPVSFAGVTTNVTAETDGMSYGAHAKGGWDVGLSPKWTSRLNLNALYIHQSQDGYTDSSNVTFGSLDTDTFRFGPSVELTGTFTNGNTIFTPRASLGYLEQWAGGDDAVDVTFFSGTMQSATIEDKDEGYTTFGVGLDALFDDRVTAFVGYDGEYGDEETRNRITAGLRIGL